MQRQKNPEDIRHDEVVLVADLAKRFAAFRRSSPRFARVPRELRESVVAAIRLGVPPGLLRRACGVSSSQLDLWQAGAQLGTARTGRETPRVRTFSVIGRDSPPPSAPMGAANGEALELRIGPWSISVRMASQEDVDRGGPSCCR